MDTTEGVSVSADGLLVEAASSPDAIGSFHLPPCE